MNIEYFREYCLSKKGTEEDFPFDETTLVFKVRGKLFALTSLNDSPGQCNLKCDPDYGVELREKYDSIIPGYHMNKKHWNSVIWDGNVPDKIILELIDHSYELVVKGLPKNLREEFNSIVD